MKCDYCWQVECWIVIIRLIFLRGRDAYSIVRKKPKGSNYFAAVCFVLILALLSCIGLRVYV